MAFKCIDVELLIQIWARKHENFIKKIKWYYFQMKFKILHRAKSIVKLLDKEYE